MKFVFALLALAALASVDAAPEGKYSTSKFFESDTGLDSAQGALEDIATADIRLAAKEGQLETFVLGESVLFDAETALEKAVKATDYANSFVGVTTAD